jgi:hypothetical protein
MAAVPMTKQGYPDWVAILTPFGFKPPCRALWLTAEHVRYLYFIQSGDLVKIGISGDPEKRIEELRRGSPLGLRLHGSIKLPAVLAFQTERRVHEALADHAVGREWFRMAAKDARRAAQPFCTLAKKAGERLFECGFWNLYEEAA